MKLFIVGMLLTSCSLFPERISTKKTPTYTEQMRECVVELIGKFGIGATESQKVCETIYRRRSEK